MARTALLVLSTLSIVGRMGDTVVGKSVSGEGHALASTESLLRELKGSLVRQCNVANVAYAVSWQQWLSIQLATEGDCGLKSLEGVEIRA